MHITHPYFTEENEEEKKEYRVVPATWDGEVTADGTPHGLGYVTYKHPEGEEESKGDEAAQGSQGGPGDYMSFKGFGVMNNGILDSGSCLIERGDGFRYSFAMMKNGRPFGPGRQYNDDESEEIVDDPETPTQVYGWAGYIGPF